MLPGKFMRQDHRTNTQLSSALQAYQWQAGEEIYESENRTELRQTTTRVVECPDCGATRTLEPHHGVLRFKQHDRVKRKKLTAKRWARREMTWKVVGEEKAQEGRMKGESINR